MRRVFIYGSCVSRDTFDFFEQDGTELVRYVARQSLVSAYSPPSSHQTGTSALESTFQRRMLEWDERSALPLLLRRHAKSIDLLMWDIVDERLGYFEFPDGSVITNSVERVSLNSHPFKQEGARHVPFGSPEHLNAFARALARFVADLNTLELLAKVAFIAPPWAVLDDRGMHTPSSFGVAAERANHVLGPYLELITSTLGAQPLGVDEPAVAAAHHKWGPAPFHYESGLYKALVARL